MKKLLYVLTLVAIFFASVSCNKENISKDLTVNTKQSLEKSAPEVTASGKACDPVWSGNYNGIIVYCDKGTVEVTATNATPSSYTIPVGKSVNFKRVNKKLNMSVKVCWKLGGGYNYYHLATY